MLSLPQYCGTGATKPACRQAGISSKGAVKLQIADGSIKAELFPVPHKAGPMLRCKLQIPDLLRYEA